MNRRTFLTIPVVALPLGAVSMAVHASKPQVAFYDYMRMDEMDMRFMVVDRKDVYMVTRYFKPNEHRYFKGVGTEAEYLDEDNRDLLRLWYPDALIDNRVRFPL